MSGESSPNKGKDLGEEWQIVRDTYLLDQIRWYGHADSMVPGTGVNHEIGMFKKFVGTFDERIVSENFYAASDEITISRNGIDALEFDKAEIELGTIRKRLNVIGTLMDESADTPAPTIRSESKIDEQIGGVEKELPTNVSGRQTRALVASEISYVERMFEKAARHHCGISFDDTSGVRTMKVEGNETAAISLRDAMQELMALKTMEAHAEAFRAFQIARSKLETCTTGHRGE